MTSLILVGYATQYGSTKPVADAIAETLREGGLAVDVKPLREVKILTGYSAVVIGAPLLMYRWHADAMGFLSRHRNSLVQLPVAVFALGPTHEPRDEGEWKDSAAQFEKELAKYPWFKPFARKILGGKYDPESLRFPLNLLAGKAPGTDIRDWRAIREWAAGLKKSLTA